MPDAVSGPPADDQAAETCVACHQPFGREGVQLDGWVLDHLDRKAHELCYFTDLANRADARAEALSGLLRGMARRVRLVRSMRRQVMADLRDYDAEIGRLVVRLAAVRALADAARRWLLATEGRAVGFSEGMHRADVKNALAVLGGPVEAPAAADHPLRSLNGPEEPGPGWDIAVAAADEAVTAFTRQVGMDLHHGTRFDLAHEVCCALYAAGCLSEVWPAVGPAEAACGNLFAWAGYRHVCDLPAGHDGAHQMGDTTKWGPYAADRGPTEVAEPAREEEWHDETCPGCDSCLTWDVPAAEAGAPEPDCREQEGATGVRCDQKAGHPIPHTGTHGDPGDEYSLAVTWPRIVEAAESAVDPLLSKLDEHIESLPPGSEERRTAAWVRTSLAAEPVPSRLTEQQGGPPNDAFSAEELDRGRAELRRRIAADLGVRHNLDDVLTEAGINPLLIGTHADPEFVAHQAHRHPVEGCGYCPEDGS